MDEKVNWFPGWSLEIVIVMVDVALRGYGRPGYNEGRAKIVDNMGLFDVRLVTAPISIYPAVSATCDC